MATDNTLKGTDQRIQIARVRRAWAAVRHNGVRKENRNSISSIAELDDLLEEGTLREVKVNFWKRYKLRYPSEVSPSDQLLSRCYKEMDKRLLTVYDIWKVKTLLHQVMSTKKRKMVAPISTHSRTNQTQEPRQEQSTSTWHRCTRTF